MRLNHTYDVLGAGSELSVIDFQRMDLGAQSAFLTEELHPRLREVGVSVRCSVNMHYPLDPLCVELHHPNFLLRTIGRGDSWREAFDEAQRGARYVFRRIPERLSDSGRAYQALAGALLTLSSGRRVDDDDLRDGVE